MKKIHIYQQGAFALHGFIKAKKMHRYGQVSGA